MTRAFIRYCMRVIFIIVVCWIVGLTRCASVPIEREVFEQQSKNDKAKQAATKYVPEGADRDLIFNALDESSRLMERQGKKLSTETARADENQSAADFLFWLKWGGGILTIGLIALYLKSR